ncbi:hypothetical protein P7K49_029453 [Saguinus oedipus]|uniref:Uncharacterized protein n=1 Tax=Saguinus oedipus TaxID=9490 RepID=A0ABQ9U790_SAGOE|nr:hypothetical protein P7K49_029453 [Saguinus oedipus]
MRLGKRAQEVWICDELGKRAQEVWICDEIGEAGSGGIQSNQGGLLLRLVANNYNLKSKQHFGSWFGTMKQLSKTER